MSIDMDRRDFLKTSLAASGALALGACAGSSRSHDGSVVTRVHPKSGDRVSLLGFGNIDELDQPSFDQLVDYALEHGVNYFDTRPGQSEEATAAALLRYPREKYFIATRMPRQDGDKSLKEGQEMLEHSLSLFQTDHIDYLVLDELDSREEFQARFLDNGLLDWLLEQRENGRVRNLGFSFHGPKEAFDGLMALHGSWDFVQIQLNYLDWKHASLVASQPGRRLADSEYLYEELVQRDIPVIAMEPLLGGRLAQLPQGPAMRLKSRAPERSTASWAYRFCGTFPRVLTIVSGMPYLEQLQDDIQSLSDFRPLSEKELAFLEETARQILLFPIIPCTDCRYCMPCPYGLDIPGIFAHHNRCINEDNIPQDAMSPGYRKARRNYLVSYEREIPGRRQAGYCIGCGECMIHCPEGINIPVQMRKIDNYTEKLRKNV